MKFTLHPTPQTAEWTGLRPLPSAITTAVSEPRAMAEWELLTAIAGLHGRLTPFDLLTNSAIAGSPKDVDLDQLLAAFQAYLAPAMPLSGYTAQEEYMPLLRSHPSQKIDKMDGFKAE